MVWRRPDKESNMSTKSRTASHGHDEHCVPVWALFLALLALTAGEVGLYECWRGGVLEVPKVAIVMIILVLTLPKAAIVMIYFMHLKFERQIITILAVVPLFLAVGAVLVIVTDTLTLAPQAQNKVSPIGVYEVHAPDAHDGQDHDQDPDGHHPPGDAANDEADDESY